MFNDNNDVLFTYKYVFMNLDHMHYHTVNLQWGRFDLGIFYDQVQLMISYMTTWLLHAGAAALRMVTNL